MRPPIELSFRWRDALVWYGVPASIVLLAFVVGIAAAVRYIVFAAEAYGLLVPLGLFGVAPLIALLFDFVQTLTNETRIRATDETIEVKWGPRGAAQRTIAAADIAQLFAVRRRARADLFAVTNDGKVVVVAQHLTPTFAREAEATLEAHLGVQDRPVRGEIPREEAARRTRWRAWLRPAAVTVVGLTVAAFAIFRLAGPTIGGVVAEVTIVDGPAEVLVRLDEATTLQVWVKMEIEWDAVLGNASRLYLDRLPHAFDLHVRIGDDEVVCDPFRVRFFEVQSTNAGITSMSVYWFGALEGCALRAGPGASSTRIELVHREESKGVRVQQATVLLRR